MIPSPGRIAPGHLLLALFLLLGLSWAQTSIADIKLTQANGETLSLPGPARRIITLAPNLAELVFASGAGDHLKAVVEYSNYPEPVRTIPRVGDAFRIDLEGIVEFKPDLVIAWKSGNPQTALQKLEQLGITVWQVEITRPEQIADAVENISDAAGTQSVGHPYAQQLRNTLAKLSRQHADKTPVTYFYQIAARPLYTINGQHIISHGLGVCGGVNVFSDLPSLAPQISREAVILEDPQAMVAPGISGEPPALAHWQDWPRLTTVKNESLLYLPADEISQATPRFLDSIELACNLLDKVRRTTQQAKK
jgi:iron complex transport system substrate-binding protein